MTKLDMTDPADVVLLDRLRALRLWHWRLGLKHRSGQDTLEALAADRKSGSLKDCIRTYREAANVHFTAVQTLNEFFEIGDTAERDANETAD